MTAINFTVFRDKIASGEKIHAIRKLRKVAPIKKGDRLTLYWHQRQPDCQLIGETVCTKTARIFIRPGIYQPYFVRVAGKLLDAEQLTKLSQDDGFDCSSEFLSFFNHWYRMPFHGQVIWWDVDTLIENIKQRATGRA
jgi:hypothetical protein